jgi:hypothetical protein
MGDYDKNQADDQGGKEGFDKGQQSQDGGDKQQLDEGKGEADDQDFGGEKTQG